MSSFVDVKKIPVTIGHDTIYRGLAVDKNNEPLFNVYETGRRSRIHPQHYENVWTYRHTQSANYDDEMKCDLCGCAQQEDKFAIQEIAIWQNSSRNSPFATYQLCPFCISEHKMTPHLPEDRLYFAYIPSAESKNEWYKVVHFIKSRNWLDFTKQTIDIDRKFHGCWTGCVAISISVNDPDSKLDARAVFEKHKNGMTISTFSLSCFYRVFSASQKFDKPVYLATASFELAMCEKIRENKVQAKADEYIKNLRSNIPATSQDELYGRPNDSNANGKPHCRSRSISPHRKPESKSRSRSRSPQAKARSHVTLGDCEQSTVKMEANTMMRNSPPPVLLDMWLLWDAKSMTDESLRKQLLIHPEQAVFGPIVTANLRVPEDTDPPHLIQGHLSRFLNEETGDEHIDKIMSMYQLRFDSSSNSSFFFMCTLDIDDISTGLRRSSTDEIIVTVNKGPTDSKIDSKINSNTSSILHESISSNTLHDHDAVMEKHPKTQPPKIIYRIVGAGRLPVHPWVQGLPLTTQIKYPINPYLEIDSNGHAKIQDTKNLWWNINFSLPPELWQRIVHQSQPKHK
jgi:hypothetical protein